MPKVEKERASLTEDEIQVSTESVRVISGYNGTHDPSHKKQRKKKKKKKDALLQIAASFGWRGQLNPLCSH